MPPRIRRAVAILVAAPLVVLVPACSDSASDAASAPGAATAPAAAPASTVPLVARLARAGDLAGFRVPAGRRLDLSAIADENDVTVAELRRRGMVESAKSELSGPAGAFGISAVELLEGPAQARAEARRLFAANGSSEPGFAATPLAVPGIPGAMGARKAGVRGGHEFAAYDVVWVEGPLVYELFALGLSDRLAPADVLAAATAIHDRTAGLSPRS